MRKVASIITAVAMGLSSAPAFAKHDDHRGWDRHDNRDWRDDRRDYDWNHRHYNNHHSWQTVTVYSQPSYPVYATRDYSEIRCTNDYNPLGLLLGGAAGAALGTTIGHGNGRTAAIATGAVLGSIVGSNMTQQRCSEQVFQDVPVGRPVSWQAGPQEAYAVVPTRDYRTDGRYCREYQAYATVGGRKSETYGTACMQPDGSWEIIN